MRFFAFFFALLVHSSWFIVRCSILPPSLFYFARGYVETSYGGQAMVDARPDAVEGGQGYYAI